MKECTHIMKLLTTKVGCMIKPYQAAEIKNEIRAETIALSNV